MMKTAGRGPKTPVALAGNKRNDQPKSTDPVEVFCRVRPPSDSNPDSENCAEVLDETTVKLVPPEAFLAQSRGAPLKMTENKFTHVFCEFSTQREAFDRVGRTLVEDLIHGKNGLLFTYGITGSGKTYTMTGNPKESGILPRCLDVIFNSIHDFQTSRHVFMPDSYNQFDVQTEGMAEMERQRQGLKPPPTPGAAKTTATPGGRRRVNVPTDGDWELVPRVPETMKIRGVDEDNAYAVFVSYIEIYNNYIYDLLDASYSTDKKAPVSKNLREDIGRNMYVNGVTEVEVKSTEEAFQVFIKGQKLRRVAHTVLNTESSRSHSVFNIRLVQAPLDRTGQEVMQDKEKVHVSQLSLVDLAGSERSGRTGHAGDRIRETGHINTSLMVLRQCIEQLRENQKAQNGAERMVPYRDSRLTHLFKNYFDGEGKVRMVVCINPQAGDYEENIHVMQFAEMTQEVEIPRGSEVKYEGEGLTPGRRRAAQLQRDLLGVLATVNEDSPLKDYPIPPTYSLMFDPMPAIEIKGPADETAFVKLRQHYEDRLKKRTEYMELAQKKRTNFESELRHFAFNMDSIRRRNEELERENSDMSAEHRRLYADNKQMQHKVSNLQLRLSKYETDARMQKNQEEQFKKKEREMVGQLRQREMKIQKVREIFENGPRVVSPNKTRSASKNRFGGSQESLTGSSSSRKGAPSGNKGTLSPSKKFGGSHDSIASPKLPVPPPRSGLAGSQTSLYPALSSTQSSRPGRAATRARRAPSPPPKPGKVQPSPHINAKYHRRSRSSGGLLIDHQSKDQVPEGTYFQPKLRNRIKTTQPETRDLGKAAEYVLRHQDYDQDAGALRSSLVKGDVVPTIAGGQAVVFKDVEQVSHVSPGETNLKRKSGEDFENSSSLNESASKRGRRF